MIAWAAVKFTRKSEGGIFRSLANQDRVDYVRAMIVPVVLLIVSVIGMAAAGSAPDVFALAALSAVAALFLVLQALWRRRRKAAEQWIVVDGSNVMYWQDNTPKMETVLAVVDRLRALGYAPGVMFDANAGYLLGGRYMHDAAMGKKLGLSAERVMVVPKGVPADPFILNAARDLGARIVTNDRYRDWVGDYPEVVEAGHLVQGGYRDGVLWLDVGA